MKQLDMFQEISKNLSSDIPSFDTWYSENTHERNQYGERPYNKKQAIKVYQHLIKIGFFHRGK